MSNYNDKLRFAMTPSGFKSGTLYSQFPNVSESDFQVVRNSIGTRVNKDGLIEVMDANVPRLDYSDGGCPKLLTEASSTNVSLKSSDLTDMQLQGSATRSSETYISPSGDNDSYLYTSNGSDGILRYKNLNGTNTLSIYAKAVSFGKVIRLKDTDGLFINVIELTQEWKRYSVVFSANTTGYWIDDFPTDGVYLWGCQVEGGSVATSLIPTNGATATRSADQVKNAGNSSTFNSNGGVLFVDFKEYSIPLLSSGQSIFSISGSGGLNLGTNTNSRIKAYIFSNSEQLNFDIPYDTLLQNKMALIYQNGDSSVYVNGLLIQTQSNVNLSGLLLNKASLDNGVGDFIVKGKTKSFQVYDIGVNVEQLTGYDSYSAMTSQFNFNVL